MFRKSIRGFVVFAVVLLVGPLVVADDAQPAPSAGDKSTAASTFRSHFQQWKDTITGLRSLRKEHQNASTENQRQALQANFEALLETAHTLLPVLRETGIAAYHTAPDDNPELTRFLFKLAKDELSRDRVDQAFELAELLVEHECGFAEIFNVAGIAAFVRNDYEKAEQYLKLARDQGVLSPAGRTYFQQIDECRALWQEEQELREQQAGELPLVKLATTQGDITVELFENEAPQTVGNFIHLVKDQQFYDGLTFHEVAAGRRAVTGCPNGDGTGDPGYKVYCECYKEDHRNHFRGSLSMETDGTRDTGGSQFFISFAPAPRLNGHYTVFGRVVDGMDVLARLENTTPASPAENPDKIVKATVLKLDEDKKYLPVKVKE